MTHNILRKVKAHIMRLYFSFQHSTAMTKKKKKNKTSNKTLSILLISVVAIAYYLGLIPSEWPSHIPSLTAQNYATQPCEGIEIPLTPQGMPEQILKKSNYTVSFNAETNIPNWVAWSITTNELTERESRSNNFQPDPALPSHLAVTTEDYTGSGYDRGHMCPAADNRYHWRAMDESFYMTNICPQNHNLNAGVWSTLEQQCRRWAENGTTVHIACGPIIYDNKPRYIGNKHKVRVPDAFFKVVLRGYEQGTPQGVGFIFENKAGKKDLSYYSCTIDEVEKITGIDFFHTLDDKEERRIEAMKAL